MVFPNWAGNADRCRCGCGSVRYSRSNPENLWLSLSPQLLWELKFLLPVFRALRNFLWTWLGKAWTVFRIVFCAKMFKDIVIPGPLDNKLSTVPMPARFLAWSVISLLLFLLVMVAWLVSRFTLFIILPLYPVALAFVAAALLLTWVLTVTNMAMYGLVFLIGAGLCTKASNHKPVTTRLVRRHLWMSPGGFSMSRRDSDSEKVPAALYDRLTDTPTYAARMYKAPLCPRSWPCRGN